MECAQIQRYFYNFFFADNFFPLAVFAAFALFNYFSLATTFITGFLNLLIHSWPHLIHLNHLAISFTGFAGFNLSSTLSIAGFTSSCSFMWDFYELSFITLLESHF